MKVNHKMFVFLMVFVQIYLPGAIQQKSSTEPGKILLDVDGISNFGKVGIESKISHPDLFLPRYGLLDKKGNIYVLDSKTCKIFKFSPRGKLLKIAGGKGNGPGENIMPVRLRQYNNKLYILDYMRPYVNVFDLELNLVEQKKFPRLMTPFDLAIVNEKEFIITSVTMPLSYQHKFFVFNHDGNMKSMQVRINYDASTAFKGNRLNIKYPSLLSFDHRSGNLWCAEITSYRIESYGKDFNKRKILQGNIAFKTEEGKAGQSGQFKMKQPKDKGIFIKVIDSKIFFGYKFNDEIILDVITEEKNIQRFKLNKIQKILSLIDANRFLVSFSHEGDEEDESAPTGIIRIGN